MVDRRAYRRRAFRVAAACVLVLVPLGAAKFHLLTTGQHWLDWVSGMGLLAAATGLSNYRYWPRTGRAIAGMTMWGLGVAAIWVLETNLDHVKHGAAGLPVWGFLAAPYVAFGIAVTLLWRDRPRSSPPRLANERTRCRSSGSCQPASILRSTKEVYGHLRRRDDA